MEIISRKNSIINLNFHGKFQILFKFLGDYFLDIKINNWLNYYFLCIKIYSNCKKFQKIAQIHQKFFHSSKRFLPANCPVVNGLAFRWLVPCIQIGRFIYSMTFSHPLTNRWLREFLPKASRRCWPQKHDWLWPAIRMWGKGKLI